MRRDADPARRRHRRPAGAAPLSTAPLSSQQKRSLLAAAERAMARAYAPYSGTRVGAAVLARSGRVHRGSSMQNASSALNACAEQAAVAAAVAAGDAALRAIAVVRSRGGVCVPCGRCLQWLSEFVPESGDLSVLSRDVVANGRAPRTVEWSLRYLQPVPYRRPADDRAGSAPAAAGDPVRGRSGRALAPSRRTTPPRGRRRSRGSRAR